jgi:hypothetical protein
VFQDRGEAATDPRKPDYANLFTMKGDVAREDPTVDSLATEGEKHPAEVMVDLVLANEDQCSRTLSDITQLHLSINKFRILVGWSTEPTTAGKSGSLMAPSASKRKAPTRRTMSATSRQHRFEPVKLNSLFVVLDAVAWVDVPTQWPNCTIRWHRPSDSRKADQKCVPDRLGRRRLIGLRSCASLPLQGLE